MNEFFRVSSLDEITKEHFAKACAAVMEAEEKPQGKFKVPCGEDYLLWEGEGMALVQLCNWCHMLTLLIVSKNGTWLTSDHIDGMGSEAVIDEAYRRFMAAKPYIEQELSHAFCPGRLKGCAEE